MVTLEASWTSVDDNLKNFFLSFVRDFIIWEHEWEWGADEEGEADSPVSREPDVGPIPGP